MKRLFSLLTVLLLAALLIVPAAASAEYGSATLTLSDVDNVAPGESFEVTFSISGNYTVHGMNLSIEYDPTCMVLESVEMGDYLKALQSSGKIVVLDCSTLSNSGMVKLGVICPTDPATGEGEALKMHFHVKDGVTVNQQVVLVVNEFIYLPLTTTQKTDVPFTTENSVITLRGGSEPGGGYNEGGSGVGDNASAAPNYPTRDPQDPDANVTPSVDVTMEPIDVSSAPTTVGPVNTADISRMTEDPNNTKEPAEEATKSAENPGIATQIPNTDPAAPTKSSPLPYIVIGVLGVLAVTAAVLIIRGRKK